MPFTKTLSVVLLLLTGSAANGQIIVRCAGTDTMGYSGDGSPATTAQLNSPWEARPDGAGNIYIADNANNRIRKVSTAGIITTVAGNGVPAHTGDGGQATAAGISYPVAVAADGSGNIYIAEDSLVGGISWIRKINPAGVITTIAGNGTAGFGGDGGPASAAQFAEIKDLVLDTAGNIYVVDLGNLRIRKINTSGMVSTIAGSGSYGFGGDGGPATIAQLGQPTGVAVDAAGNVYITDATVVRKIDTGDTISTIAGDGTDGYSGDGGPATAAELSNPAGIAVDGAGNVYLADVNNMRIRKVSTTGFITTIAGDSTAGFTGDGGPATAAELDAPQGVSVDNMGIIYIADVWANNVRKIIPPGLAVIAPAAPSTETLRVWPVPNDGYFTLSVLSETNESARVVITNIIGKKIKEITIATNTETGINLDVPPGMYFVTAITGEGRQGVKAVVR